MKRYLNYIFILFTIVSCSQEEIKLELFSPEAFVFSLDSGWELHASIQIKGFKQNQNDELFLSSLSYSADLIEPNGTTLTSVNSGVLNQKANEELLDLDLDLQMGIDSSFAIGRYKIIFNVKDEFSGKTSSIETYFELTAE